MTDQDCVLNIPVIDQWIDDLTDKELNIVFNADIQFGRTPRGKLTGDAAFFLAYRNAPHADDEALLKWLRGIEVPRDEDYLPSELIVHTYTRIPMKDVKALLWPQILLDEPDYHLEKMTPRQFVKTLKAYLETGVVSWAWLLPNEA